MPTQVRIPTPLRKLTGEAEVVTDDGTTIGEILANLDKIILGNLKDFAGYRGKFAILRDPYYPQRHGSAIMSWQAGFLDHVWTTWDRGGRPQFDPAGDQKWIEAMQPKADFWQDMFPGQVLSYKAHIRPIGYVPERTRIVVFHGRPKPHEMGFEVIVNQP